MSLQQLNAHEKDIILTCIKAIMLGPFLEEWEFQTRMGITRAKVKEVVNTWLSEKSPNVKLAINNSLNEICNGITITPEEWDKWIGKEVSEEQVSEIFKKWKSNSEKD